MIVDYTSIALKNLRRRGIRSWLTLLGIFIGIATVVSLISLGGGLRSAVLSQFGISSTELIQIQAGGLNSFGPPGSGVSKPLTLDDVRAIKRLNSVDAAIPRQIVTVKAEFKDKLIINAATNIVYGDDRELIYEVLDIEAFEGKLLEDNDDGKVVLGNNFYFEDKNGFESEIRIGDNILINGKNYKVSGILKKKGSFIFDQIIILNDNDLKSISDYGDNVDLIAVKVRNKELIDTAKKEIEDLLRDRRDVKIGEEDFEVSTPQAALDTVNQVLTGIQIFVALIAAISIIVGSIGIVNTMTTSVLERVKEIGVMKAIGARNNEIFSIFVFEAGFLGLVAGIIGILIGFIITSTFGIILNNLGWGFLSPHYSIELFLGCIIFATLTGAISGVIPAWNASRIRPVKALRYE